MSVCLSSYLSVSLLLSPLSLSLSETATIISPSLCQSVCLYLSICLSVSLPLSSLSSLSSLSLSLSLWDSNSYLLFGFATATVLVLRQHKLCRVMHQHIFRFTASHMRHLTYHHSLLYRYISFFQVPYIPELNLQMSDLDSLRNAFKGRAFGLKSGNMSDDDVEAYKYTFQSQCLSAKKLFLFLVMSCWFICCISMSLYCCSHLLVYTSNCTLPTIRGNVCKFPFHVLFVVVSFIVFVVVFVCFLSF